MNGQGYYQDGYIDEPIENGLIMRRTPSGVALTNVPHLLRHHSDGFEFGYGGSGPADLALNAVECLLRRMDYRGPRVNCFEGDCFELAYTLHQEFKWQFISGVPREGGTVLYEDVRLWLLARLTAAEVAQ